MARHILMCRKCSKFTMKESCETCNEKTFPVKPPKFSPDEKYADLKRKAKRKYLEEKGMI